MHRLPIALATLLVLSPMAVCSGSPRPVAVWRLDRAPRGTVVPDVGGSSLHLSVRGRPAFGKGPIGPALRFDGKSVCLAAADTYRAAAVEQLGVWADRIGVDVIKGAGSDPAAVAFDACDAAVARKADVLLVDTAGRMHTEANLMRELVKVRDVVAKKIPGAPHEVLLVLDATTGQNAIDQARAFAQAIDVTGIFLAKLDGTAKGGIVAAIRHEVDLPVKFVGLGETYEDVEPFDPESFVDSLFA